MSPTRLNKLLSQSGIASRRAADDLIRQGRVTINGQVVDQLGTKADPARDDVNARTRFLQLMAHQAERMTRLIDDLLSLSRVEMRVHLPPRGIVELNETASYVCQSLEPVAETANAKVSFVRQEGPARIRGDREEVVQVLQNLIQNAI